MSFWKIRFEGLAMNLENILMYRNKVLRFGMSDMSNLY